MISLLLIPDDGEGIIDEVYSASCNRVVVMSVLGEGGGGGGRHSLMLRRKDSMIAGIWTAALFTLVLNGSSVLMQAGAVVSMNCAGQMDVTLIGLQPSIAHQ